jgi:hypothetical protein
MCLSRKEEQVKTTAGELFILAMVAIPVVVISLVMGGVL